MLYSDKSDEGQHTSLRIEIGNPRFNWLYDSKIFTQGLETLPGAVVRRGPDMVT